MSQPEESKGKTGKTDPTLRGRHAPAAPENRPRVPGAPTNLPPVPPMGAAEPIDPAVRAQELAHADEPAEREK